MIRKAYYYLFSGTALFIERVGIPFLGKIDPYFFGSFVARYLTPLLTHQIKNKNHPNVLCNNRLTFERDLQVLKQGDKFNYIEFNSLCIGQIMSIYMPKWMRHQVIFQLYIEQDKYANIRNKMEQFALGFINTVQKSFKIDCGLMSGIDYYQDYGFHLAYKKLNIPFAAMFYENHTIPSGQFIGEHLYRDFQYKFSGDAVAALSEKTANLFKNAGVCDPAKIHVTGAPRLDPLYQKMQHSVFGNKMVLFAYPGDEYGATLNFIQTVHEFAEASLKMPNMEFILKSKFKEHEKLINSYLEGLHHRVKVITKVDIFKLLLEARSVISFNSLTCLESLLSKAHVYVPHYGDSRLPDVQLQVSPSTAGNVPGLTFLMKPGELIRHLEADSKKTQHDVFDRQSRADFFKKYFYVTDSGSNRENLENLIASVMHK